MILGKSDLFFEDQKLMAVSTDCIQVDAMVGEVRLPENVYV